MCSSIVDEASVVSGADALMTHCTVSDGWSDVAKAG